MILLRDIVGTQLKERENRMIKYFKELLKTLKAINSNLGDIKQMQISTDNHLEKLASCVQEKHHGHGDQASISTKHWNQ